MDTKTKGSIGVSMFVTECLKRDMTPSVPVGDGAPYDLIIDTNGKLFKIQVKVAYRNKYSYIANARMAKTNRTSYKYEHYKENDFDVFVGCVIETNSLYIIPWTVFSEYSSGLTLSEKSPLNAYKDNWSIFENNLRR